MISSLLILVLAQQEATYDLRPHYKVGEKLHYRYELKIALAGQSLLMTGFRTDTIKKVDPSGAFVKESVVYGEKTLLEGREMRTSPTPNETQNFDKNNRAQISTDPEADRKSRIIALILPDKAIKLTDYWVAETVAVQNRPAVKSAFQFKSIENGKFRIEFLTSERDVRDPMTASGYYLLDEKTKVVTKVQGQITGAIVMGTKANYSITIDQMKE